MIYDVIVIGAGVTGSAVARELSRYDLNVCVLEKGEDVCSGTSKANSAIIHAGFDAPVGSLKARFNVRGNEMMDELSRDLDIPFKRNGAFVICLDEKNLPGLQELYDRGIANGVPADSMEILTGDEVRTLEPNLSDKVVGAFYAKTSGIVCPFLLNIAMAENACTNGVDFFFNTEVQDIRKAGKDGNQSDEQKSEASADESEEKTSEDIWLLRTNNGVYKTRWVVNAAGVHADFFHNMVSRKKLHITPRRGEYVLLDHAAGDHVSRTIFQQPTKMGKGILVTPTIHGNLLVGPTAADIENREGTNTTAAGLNEAMTKAQDGVKNIPFGEVITSFAGLRAVEDGGDFVVGEVEDAPHFVDCAGMQSPGLSASPAVGEYVGNLLKERMHLIPKKHWNGKRKGILNPSTLSFEERNELIRRNPAYGHIICRCESVTEGEILDAIKRPIGAKSLDGVKRRVRAGMGRCQAGFCSPKVMELLHRELGVPMKKVTKSGGESRMVLGRTKDFAEDENVREMEAEEAVQESEAGVKVMEEKTVNAGAFEEGRS